MITLTQLDEMLATQLQANNSVNACWMDAKYPFDRAVAIQCSAAVASGGWAWKQYREPDKACTALTNIWRCILSRHLTQAQGSVEVAADSIATELVDPRRVFFDFRAYTFSKMPAVPQIELLAGMAISHRIYLPLFVSIMEACQVQWRDIEQCIKRAPLSECAYPILVASQAASALLAA